MAATLCDALRTFTATVCVCLCVLGGCDGVPSAPAIADYGRGVCCMETGKECLCSPNDNFVLDMVIPHPAPEALGRPYAVNCGTRVSSDRISISYLTTSLSLNHKFADRNKMYLILVIDADGSSRSDSVWAVWIRNGVSGAHLDGQIPDPTLVNSGNDLSVAMPPGSQVGHRVQIYLFEHDGSPLKNSVSDANRDQFNFKKFTRGNKLCSSLVSGFQMITAQNPGRRLACDVTVCPPTCGVGMLSVWGAHSGGTLHIKKQLLFRAPKVTFKAASDGKMYVLLMSFFFDHKHHYGWFVADIRGEDLQSGTRDGNNRLVTYRVPTNLPPGTSFHAYFFLWDYQYLDSKAYENLARIPTIEQQIDKISKSCDSLRAVFCRRVSDADQLAFSTPLLLTLLVLNCINYKSQCPFCS